MSNQYSLHVLIRYKKFEVHSLIFLERGRGINVPFECTLNGIRSPSLSTLTESHCNPTIANIICVTLFARKGWIYASAPSEPPVVSMTSRNRVVTSESAKTSIMLTQLHISGTHCSLKHALTKWGFIPTIFSCSSSNFS